MNPILSSRRLILFAALTIALFTIATHAQMKMHVINVGQAESIIFEFPHDAILVDAGAHKDNDREHLFEYIEAFFDRRTDLERTFYAIVISHPHPDHTNRLKEVIQRYRILHFIDGGGNANSHVRAAREMLPDEGAEYHAIYAKDVKRSWFMRKWREDLTASSGVNVRFLSAGRDCNDQNNASLVMRVEYMGKKFLTLGDAEEDDKEGSNLGCGGLLYRLVNPQAGFPGLVNVDVYKVGHHGARNGTVDALLKKVTPMYAVISAGDNHQLQTAGSFSAWDHGHPNIEAVERLEARVSQTRTPKTVTVMRKQESELIDKLMTKAIYSTGWDGDIVFSVDATGVLSPPEIGN